MVASALTLAAAFLSATRRNFETGKLVSVTEDEGFIEGP
jgi:hypothetical protein